MYIKVKQKYRGMFKFQSPENEEQVEFTQVPYVKQSEKKLSLFRVGSLTNLLIK